MIANAHRSGVWADDWVLEQDATEDSSFVLVVLVRAFTHRKTRI